MKNNNNTTIGLIILFLVLNGCQSLKDGLGTKKKNNADTFMIEKKNPLTKPPDYNKLPIPESAKSVEDENKDEKFDIEKLLRKSSVENKKKPLSKNLDTDLKKLILDKIKNN
jgi:hypothetical protein